MFKKSDWLIPTGLIILCVIPMLGGIARISDLFGNGKITPENARFFTAPSIVILHIVISCFFGILGALQFSPGFRKRNIHWHKTAGKPLIASGLISALTGLWLTYYFPKAEFDGPTLYFVRILVGVCMSFCILKAILAIRKRNFKNHGEWMIRGYALGLGAGTQVLTHLPWLIFTGTIPTGFVRDAAMASGWLINFIAAEWIIRRGNSIIGKNLIEQNPDTSSIAG